MTSGRHIVKHTGILMFMELGIRVLDALVSIVLARYLAPQGFGLLAFAISFPSIFSVLPGFGMGALVTRDIARDPQHLNRYLTNGLMIKLILAILTLLAVWATALILRFPPYKIQLITLGALLLIFETNVRFVLSFFQAAEKMTTVALVTLAVRGGWVVFSFVVVAFKGGITELLGVRALLNGAGLVVSVILIHFLLGRIRWSFDIASIWKLTKASFPFALFRIFGTVYTDIDTVMLSSMRGDVMAGFYSAAYKFLRLFTFIQSGFFSAFLPAAAKISRTSKEDLVSKFQLSIKYLSIISLPIAGGICVLADPLVKLVYGPSYAGAVPALRLIIWSMVFVFLNSATTAAIVAVDEEKKGSVALLLGALLSGLSNLIVIPLFGHAGAAATTVLAEGFVYGFQARLLRKHLPQINVWIQALKPFLATVVMMIIVWLGRGLNLILIIPVAAAVYLIGLVILREVGLVEWTVFREMMRRKSSDAKD